MTRLEVSDNHPFWVQGHGWVESAKLQRGMKLQAYDKSIVTVANVADLGREAPTFNLTVADYHTFFAGESKAFVHNACACATGGPLWTATKNQSSVENAYRHYRDHGADFGAVNALDYVRQAQEFLWTPGPSVLSKVRANGDTVRFDPLTEAFGVMDKAGAPRTFYVPDPAKHGYVTNMDYFNAQ